jgi:nitrate/nitrite transporter NarK
VAEGGEVVGRVGGFGGGGGTVVEVEIRSSLVELHLEAAIAFVLYKVTVNVCCLDFSEVDC